MKKKAKSGQEDAPVRSDLEAKFDEAFRVLDPGRQKSLLFVLGHAVEAINKHPDLSFEDAFGRGIAELEATTARVKEIRAKALRIVRGKQKLPSSRGLRAFLG
jgi:hypothetical protein